MTTTRPALIALAAVLSIGGLVLAAPRFLVEELDRRAGEVLFSLDATRPVLALTIDDGPSRHTGEILDLLDAHGVEATFFLIGERVRARPDVVRRIVAEGHEIANHAMEDRTSVLLGEEEFERRLLDADRILSRFDEPEWFRPGGGWFDGGMVRRARRAGYRVALGSMLPIDAWLPVAPVVAEYVEYHARPGAILILHDGPDRGAKTVEVLRELLPALERKGLDATTLSGVVGATEG
ncbi:MAG: polysaccharide deacetylase family protein [Gemmatimonadota bacterium]|nr:polysaccharide deacetylase family protein [Gemmatimonadota bacterium]